MRSEGSQGAGRGSLAKRLCTSHRTIQRKVRGDDQAPTQCMAAFAICYSAELFDGSSWAQDATNERSVTTWKCGSAQKSPWAYAE